MMAENELNPADKKLPIFGTAEFASGEIVHVKGLEGEWRVVAYITDETSDQFSTTSGQRRVKLEALYSDEQIDRPENELQHMTLPNREITSEQMSPVPFKKISNGAPTETVIHDVPEQHPDVPFNELSKEEQLIRLRKAIVGKKIAMLYAPDGIVREYWKVSDIYEDTSGVWTVRMAHPNDSTFITFPLHELEERIKEE